MKKCVFTLPALLGFTLLFCLFAPVRAAAQDGGDGDDPPSRVARLSFTRGAVSFQPAGTDDWVDATLNRPMTTGDQLWTDSGSRRTAHWFRFHSPLGEHRLLVSQFDRQRRPNPAYRRQHPHPCEAPWRRR